MDRLKKIEKTILWLGAIIVIALAAYLFVGNLGASSVSVASDEVVYVRVAQTSVHQGIVFPLAHGNQPFYEKPPLKLWLSSAVLAAFGERNATFRLLDGCLGIVAVVGSIWIAVSMFGSVASALAVGFFVLCAPEWVISHHSFRRAVLDGLLTVLTILAGYHGWRWIAQKGGAERSNRDLALFSIYCSLGVLTKSVAGLVPILCMGICVMTDVRTRKNILRFVFAAFIPFLTLGLYVAVLYGFGGMGAIRTFLGIEIYDRVMHGFAGHNTGDPFFYLHYLFVRGGILPRWLLIAGSAGTIFAARHNDRFRFLLAWGGVPVLLYSLSSSRVPWYLNPFAPFIVMLGVYGTLFILERISRSSLRVAVCAVILTATLPAYYRAINRYVAFVQSDTKRIELDRLVEQIEQRKGPVTLVGNCISGRSSPRGGRFNVEGIYREILKPRLVALDDVSQLPAAPTGIVILELENAERAPKGARELGRVGPTFGRPQPIVALAY